VIFFDRLVPTDRQASIASRFAFVKELPQGFRQGGLILLDRQQVVAAPFQYFLGDLRLIPSCHHYVVNIQVR
jgi:hypothetical protein